MQGKVGTDRGEHSNWCARQLEQQHRMDGMAQDRMGAGQGQGRVEGTARGQDMVRGRSSGGKGP